MKTRWKILLPAFGLLLFSFGSYESFAHPLASHGRYFWWSSIRLDSDPLGKHVATPHAAPCNEGEGGCLDVNTLYIVVDSGRLARVLILSGAPAFLVGVGFVHMLARFGISEVVSFMVAMPILLASWFYLVGWRLDRWRARRSS